MNRTLRSSIIWETIAHDLGWVEPRGLEPLTLCLQSRCATNCAMAP